ncbi:DUF862-domain-containing protein [Polychaeton citri CBS 116435]|uniref:DUF862-domain-containing protein n=1 Tax=Polychaeton citri CBS 116435 TaxID=1314669 RepID=A0A9P4QB54_9PEZI|nr:DUF862-domain-containing protein [Polychaeton citri CBS 116435]
MATAAPKPKRPTTSRKSSTLSRRSTQQEKTEIIINVYDLLPPGKLSTLLWTLGGSLLHSGLVINDREYAYGGHARRNVTGVYYTRPRLEPPGGTFRCSILQGFSFRPRAEIEHIIHEVSQEFLGPGYNLLSHNCNHFTSVLCQRLTGRAAPSWLNRAASIGVALPCVVPRDWISPPECETMDEALVEEEEEEEDDHRSGRDQGQGSARPYRDETPPPRLISLKDSSGRDLPTAERAPMPKRSSTYS